MKIVVPHQYEPRNYQLNAWNYLDGGGTRAVCVWHRRAGKDLFGINRVSVASCTRPGLYWHIFPTYAQGRKIAWDGMTREGRPFLDHFPKQMIRGDPNNTEMKIRFVTGSIYQVVGAEDPNRLVGPNPVGVILSEYSLQDPAAWDLLRPILAENGGWALFIYTARGRNHGYKILQMARKNPNWFAEVLVAGSGKNSTKRPDGTPVISDAIIQEERDSGMPEELIQQEFYNSFDAPLVGAYYGTQMAFARKEGRVTKVPWEPRLPVNTAWDLGIDDSMTIWFYQEVNMERRFIDYYENSGEGLPHYAKELEKRPYVYGKHMAPWDIDVRELGTGKTRLETARSLGIRFIKVVQHSIEDGIDAVRNILPSCWFDEEKCSRGVEALTQYRKEWDEERKVFMNHPLHDWTSHAADGFRTFAFGSRGNSGNRRGPPQRRAIDEYDVLAQ